MLDVSRVATFSEFFTKTCHLHRDKLALTWRPRYRAERFTYGELYGLATQVAAQFERFTLRPGDRVVLWAGNSPWWVAVFIACQLKGLVVIPLGPQSSPALVKKISAFVDATLRVQETRLMRPEDNVKTWAIEEIGALPKTKASLQKVVTKSSDIAELLFTSGTTGAPKGVELRHSNILSNLSALQKLSLMTEHDRMISFLPLSHVFEQVAGLLTPLSYGISITQATRVSGLHIRLNMEEDHPTIMTAVPEFLRLAISRIEERAKHEHQHNKLRLLYGLGSRLPMPVRRLLARKVLKNFGDQLRTIVVGGAALDPDVGKRWEAFGVYVLQGYGATETSPVIAVNTFKDRTMDSVGRPIPGVSVKISKDGEILVKGPNVALGYYRDPEKTAKAFRNGWYYTDDLGVFDWFGRLHVRGRKQFLIVTPAGENVYPDELEALLNKQPLVSDSAVLGLETGGHFEIHAVVLAKPGATLDTHVLRDAVNLQLESHQRIQGISLWDGEDFPRSATRKVKKKEVLEWLHSRTHGRGKGSTTQSLVQRLAALATGISASEVHPETTLRELRMDSLARVTFVSAIEEELGVVLDEAALLPTTTVQEIDQRVLRKEQKEERFPLRRWPLSRPVIGLRLFFQTILIRPFLFVISKRSVTGRENLAEQNGPLVMVCNHESGIEAAFILRALPYKLRKRVAIAAATDAFFEKAVNRRYLKFLLFFFNIFPFARKGQVRSSFEYAGKLVDRGFSLLFFPEGELSKSGRLEKFKPGTGLMVREMQLPVLPVSITGTNILVPPGKKMLKFGVRPRVHVTFGKPITFSSDEPQERVTNRVHRAVAELLPLTRQPLRSQAAPLKRPTRKSGLPAAASE